MKSLEETAHVDINTGTDGTQYENNMIICIYQRFLSPTCLFTQT